MINTYETFMRNARKDQKILKINNLVIYSLLLFISYKSFIYFSEAFNNPAFALAGTMLVLSLSAGIGYWIALYRFMSFKKQFDKDQMDAIMQIVSNTRKTQEYADLNKMLHLEPLKTSWVIAYKFNKSLIDFNQIPYEKSEWVCDWTKKKNLSYEDLSKSEVTWEMANNYLKEAQSEIKA